MFKPLIHKFISFWAGVANIGITNDLAFNEKKKTQLLNVVVATGIPVNFLFAIVNILQHKNFLSIFNMLLFAGGVVYLIINRYRKFLLGRLILTFLTSFLFTAMAVLYRNGDEHFLIVNLVVVIIYFNEKKYLILISIVNCLLFIAVKIYLNSGPVYDTVSFGRVIFNISWTLLIIILALMYFKNEQFSYQQQIEEKNRDLQALNDTKQKLFSIIAHDLRSPIGQLKNSLDLVSKEYMTPEVFKQVSTKLSSEVDQLHSTLDNLLKWSISQFQGITAVPEKVVLSDLIPKKIKLFKQSVEQKNITIQFEAMAIDVWADPEHLRLVLRNLISNAIKYSNPGGIIRISASANDNRVVIEIADNGVGMNEEVKSAIFNSSLMISNTGTSNEKGTGLGLKLCKEFIEKNNGQIRVESIEHKGSTFYIALPQAT
jgi:two-component system sensor histidine kinase/response regulator